MAQLQQLGSARDLALSSVHGIAFHRGLGTPLHPSSSTALEEYINAENLADFGSAAYAKPNIAVVANGADHKDLGKWVGQFFEDVRSSPFSGIPSLESPPSKYYGGEERISHNGVSTMILGFSGSSSFAAPGNNFKPEYNVLAALLGGDSSIKWSRGFSILSQASAETGARVSTTNASYSDAGLLYIEMRGGAKGVAAAAKKVVEALKSLSNTIKEEDFMKAKALAKFKALEGGQNIDVGLELTGSGLINGGKPHQLDEIAQAIQGVKLEAVKEAAKAAIEGKASVSSVGDLFVLPWAEEMGLGV